MCKRTQNLHNSRKSVPLHRVFHSIRFKVNKRLEYSGTPFFMPIRKIYARKQQSPVRYERRNR